MNIYFNDEFQQNALFELKQYGICKILTRYIHDKEYYIGFECLGNNLQKEFPCNCIRLEEQTFKDLIIQKNLNLNDLLN